MLLSTWHRMRPKALFTAMALTMVTLLSVSIPGMALGSTGTLTSVVNHGNAGVSFEASNPYEEAGDISVPMQTHSHTLGDTASTIRLIQKYAERGYGALAITDFQKLNWPWPVDPSGMIPVMGTEFDVGDGRHFISLFDDFLPPSNPEPQKCLDEIRAKNGISIIAHPNVHANLRGWSVDELAGLDGYSGIEIYNRCIRDWRPGQEYAVDTWDALLSRQKRVWGFAVDDYEHLEAGFDQGRIVVLPRDRSASAIRSAIRRGSFYSVVGQDQLIFNKVEVQGPNVIVALNKPADIRFVGKGGKILKRTSARDTCYTLKGNEGYLRIEARSSTATAYANPISVERTPAEFSNWYLCEGSTAWGFNSLVHIENPNNTAVSARITYMTSSGEVPGGTVRLPGSSQTTVNPRDTLGERDFSARVVCTEGKTICVDRTMSWNAGSGEERHSAVGVTGPNQAWYLPEGSSRWGFECWLLVQNPSASLANCEVTYMIEGSGTQTVEHQVPANGRASFNLGEDLKGEFDASIKLESDVPVIAERAMYRNNRREGHDSIGTTRPASDYYLAEGCSGFGFTTYVLVMNPNREPIDVSVTYMTGAREVAGPSFQAPPYSRKTINVNATTALPDPNFSTRVNGSKPIIAERAMYWDNGTGEACHDSIGMDTPHTTFYLPDGETYGDTETYTLVQNPNDSAVTVQITYMTPAGTGNVVKTETIDPGSRRTFNMLEHSLINGRAAIMVTSKTAGKPIMVERAMYWNNRGAGTDTIGGYSD